MSRLFGRRVYVDLAAPDESQGRRLDGLRISFRVQHRASRSLSTASVDVYNPAPASIGAVSQLVEVPSPGLLFGSTTVRRGGLVRLWAGYEGNVGMLFQGNPIRDGVTSMLTSGGDRVLTVQCADGGIGFTDAYITESISSTTPWSHVIDIILRETGWARGEIALPTGYVLPGGGVFMTRVSELLDRAAALVPPVGGKWFVRDGALYLVPLGRPTFETAPLISSTSGNLVGSPTPTENGVHVTALIDPSMRAGKAFVLESRDVNGTYVAQDVTFSGDSGFATTYYMDITGKAVGSV